MRPEIIYAMKKSRVKRAEGDVISDRVAMEVLSKEVIFQQTVE